MLDCASDAGYTDVFACEHGSVSFLGHNGFRGGYIFVGLPAHRSSLRSSEDKPPLSAVLQPQIPVSDRKHRHTKPVRVRGILCAPEHSSHDTNNAKPRTGSSGGFSHGGSSGWIGVEHHAGLWVLGAWRVGGSQFF